MATKPTKDQRKACDLLAGALAMIAEAARLDGRGVPDPSAWAVITARVAGVSSAFGLDEIVALSLQRRAEALGLPGSTAEMLTLIESSVGPRDMLLLDDEAIRELAARADEELDA